MPKIGNRTALFKVLPDQQLLHLKLPHIIEYVLQYEYEYSSFLGKTSGKGEYQIINMDLDIQFGIKGTTPKIYIGDAAINLGKSKMQNTNGLLMKLVALAFNSIDSFLAFMLKRYPMIINSIAEAIPLNFNLPLPNMPIQVKLGVPSAKECEHNYTSFALDVSF